MRVNWSLVISAISLVLSVYAAFSVWYQSHRKTMIKCNWFCSVDDRQVFSLNCFNPSSDGIVINGVSFKTNETLYHCAQWPVILMTQGNKKVLSDGFPVNISAKTSRNIICVVDYLPKDLVLDKGTFYIEINGKETMFSIDLKTKVIDSYAFFNVLESSFV